MCAAEMKMFADVTLSGCPCPRVITYYALLINDLFPSLTRDIVAVSALTLRLICVLV